ncbi:MAG: HAD family hydrolase [Gammaproteobacteria bacterium]|nr:HAD family hydrolase [Gammaproteobacteria bacterium]
MILALFDLDNTLIGGDSDYLWGQHLCDIGAVDREWFKREHDRYYREYLEGTLDIADFLRFQLAPLADNSLATLMQWRDDYMETRISPIILPRARELVASHRHRGHLPVIITATNRFITEPIARELGVEHLIATEPAVSDEGFTGEVSGTPSYAQGKVSRLEQWLNGREESLHGSWFYSDSHNDIPLLERVDNPVAVDPDAVLREEATKRDWPIISLR